MFASLRLREMFVKKTGSFMLWKAARFSTESPYHLMAGFMY